MASHARKLKTYPGFLAITVACMAMLYAPMLVISIYSFNATRSITEWGGFSLNWYQKVFSNPEIQGATINSLIIAVTASTLATIFAVLAAVAMIRGRRFGGQGTCYLLINLPLMVPEIITAVGSLIFFLAIGINLGLLTVMIAHTVFCIPFAYLPISARLRGIERHYEQAARDLYCTPWQSFRYVLLPLMLPGVLSGYVLAFIISLDDFIITNMVAGPGATTLPLAIYGMVRVGFTPEINAISTLMLLASLVFVTLSYLAGRAGK
jgi:spermidine/putrescine transport system permease protein